MLFVGSRVKQDGLDAVTCVREIENKVSKLLPGCLARPYNDTALLFDSCEKNLMFANPTLKFLEDNELVLVISSYMSISLHNVLYYVLSTKQNKCGWVFEDKLGSL